MTNKEARELKFDQLEKVAGGVFQPTIKWQPTEVKHTKATGR